MLERLFPQQADDKLFVEDVFSTYLYTGNGATQTITNGIDLAGKGGLIWSKGRSGASGAQRHNLFDTARGKGSFLSSNSTNEQFTFTSDTQDLTSFNSNGFSVGIPYNANVNQSSTDYATWTFRKAPNFFDVVTYTGNGSTQTIAHSLGVAPGFILVKPLAAGEWHGYHRSLGATQDIQINYGDPAFTFTCWDNTEPTSTNFTVKTNINSNGQTYVAYLFAHDPSADGIIQCGSFGGGGLLRTVTLGWEPQWVLTKPADVGGSDWRIFDTMRGMPAVSGGGQARTLRPNTSGAEGAYGNDFLPTATGFQAQTSDGSNNTIYVAIRRGPMRTPTLGTSVFNAQANLTTDANKITTGFVTDWFWERGAYNASGNSFQCSQRLTQTALTFSSTAAEGGPYGAPYLMFDYNDGFLSNLSGNINPGLMYGFRRAPGFMDVVCYTGNGTAGRTVNHNLGVVPELMIVKLRSASGGGWATYVAPLGNTQYLYINSSNAAGGFNQWNNTSPTATQFTVSTSTDVNGSGTTHVAYLFASVPGVSKVGSYTGNGSSQTINCAFTTGARFVLIKRTDNTGDWWVWDSARGIVAGNDPALRLNSTLLETTGIDSVDPDSTGFIVNQDATTNINVNGASYIFLSIA